MPKPRHYSVIVHRSTYQVGIISPGTTGERVVVEWLVRDLASADERAVYRRSKAASGGRITTRVRRANFALLDLHMLRDDDEITIDATNLPAAAALPAGSGALGTDAPPATDAPPGTDVTPVRRSKRTRQSPERAPSTEGVEGVEGVEGAEGVEGTDLPSVAAPASPLRSPGRGSSESEPGTASVAGAAPADVFDRCQRRKTHVVDGRIADMVTKKIKDVDPGILAPAMGMWHTLKDMAACSGATQCQSGVIALHGVAADVLVIRDGMICLHDDGGENYKVEFCSRYSR